MSTQYPGAKDPADVQTLKGMQREWEAELLWAYFGIEASGPDTHYKALQAVAEAVRMYDKEFDATGMRIWGYRNVWYRFKPAEADCMVPVSLTRSRSSTRPS